jgi:hypothetical protein
MTTRQARQRSKSERARSYRGPHFQFSYCLRSQVLECLFAVLNGRIVEVKEKKKATDMPYPQNNVLYQSVIDATDNEFLFFHFGFSPGLQLPTPNSEEPEN